MYYEKQLYDYAVAFISRQQARTVDSGHFYLESYGIKVKGLQIHETSLQNCSSYNDDPDFIQHGLCIITSIATCLTGVWKKYALILDIDFNAVTKEVKKTEQKIYF